MAPSDGAQVPRDQRPSPEDVRYDLDRALAAVVGLRASVPEDAFTAETLGTERAGHGVVIDGDGLVLTIGYLIAEATEVWLDAARGGPVPAHPIAYDYETGFGLVRALRPLEVPALILGDSRRARPGVEAVVAGAGGRAHALMGQIVARQEFAGYWEYLLDDAIFTAPAHPHWGGTALIGPGGDLLGIGSLQLQHQAGRGQVVPLNMMVPIDQLKPILPDLLSQGRARRPARPWLGLFATEDEDSVVVIGLAGQGPARRAELRQGDVIRAVGGEDVDSLLGFYRALWALGEAGVEVPLTLEREGDVFDLVIRSDDRARYLKVPRPH
ncbi:MAG TPA: S1C family serine protease [Salinarimonas sp.]|jgi:S1-C subfamily serine protease|nr:S1C family serine protease [Salinarimonas sp.]